MKEKTSIQKKEKKVENRVYHNPGKFNLSVSKYPILIKRDRFPELGNSKDPPG